MRRSLTACGLRFISSSFFLLLSSLLVNLDEGVADHADAEDDDEDDELGDHADVAGVGEGDDEADALPEAVVGEGGLLAVGEEHAVEGCKIQSVIRGESTLLRPRFDFLV